MLIFFCDSRLIVLVHLSEPLSSHSEQMGTMADPASGKMEWPGRESANQLIERERGVSLGFWQRGCPVLLKGNMSDGKEREDPEDVEMGGM